MTTIYLIRHGQASFGAENYDQLSYHGELQAKLLGEYLNQILKEESYIVAGSMQRHQQTAKISLAEYFPNSVIITDSAWNEFNHQQVFTQYEPRFKDLTLLKQDIAKHIDPHEYLSKIFKGAIQRWVTGKYDAEYDESWLAFKARVENGLDHLCQELLKTKPHHAVVYTSGGVISVVAGKLLGLSVEKTFELNWIIANTSLTIIRLIGGKPQLLSLNEHHFIKAKHPELLTWI